MMKPKPVWQGRKLIPKHELEESNFEEGGKTTTTTKKPCQKKSVSSGRKDITIGKQTQKGGYEDKNNPSEAKLALEVKNRMADIKSSMTMLHDKIEKTF